MRVQFFIIATLLLLSQVAFCDENDEVENEISVQIITPEDQIENEQVPYQNLIKVKQDAPPPQGMETAGENPAPAPVTTEKDPAIVAEGPESKQNDAPLFVGIVIGTLLLIYGLVMQCFSEYRIVKNQRNMDQLIEKCVEINALELNPSNTNTLVFVRGNLNCVENIEDPATGISFKNTVLIKRDFEMFQYKEIKHKDKIEVGKIKIENKRYEYKKKWKNHYIDSSKFKQDCEGQGFSNNKDNFFAKDDEYFYCPDIKLGNLSVKPHYLKKVQHEKRDLTPTEEMLQQVQNNQKLKAMFKEIYLEGKYIKLAKDRSSDSVGDVRIKYQTVENNDLFCMVGNQNGDTIDRYYIEKDQPKQGGCPDKILCCAIKQKRGILGFTKFDSSKISLIERQFEKVGEKQIIMFRVCVYFIYFFANYLIYQDYCKFHEMNLKDQKLPCGELAGLAALLVSFVHLFIVMGLNYLCYKLWKGILYLVLGGIINVVFYIWGIAILMK